MANIKRSASVSQFQQMSVATLKYLANVASLPIDGQEMTPAQIASSFDDLAASGQAVQAAHAARSAAIKTDQDKREARAPFVKNFTGVVRGLFAQSPDTLAAFGLTPVKTPKRSVASMAGAVLKNRATRKARGTMGKKQKAQITGTLGASELAAIGALASTTPGSVASSAAPSPSDPLVAAAPVPVPSPATNGMAATLATKS